MDFIKEMQQTKENSINKVVELIINGIEFQHIVRKKGYDGLNKEDDVKPRISFAFGTANSNEIQGRNEIDISVRDNMSEIERRVNEKAGIRAIEYRVDRLNHYFKLLL